MACFAVFCFILLLPAPCSTESSQCAADEQQRSRFGDRLTRCVGEIDADIRGPGVEEIDV